MKFLSVASMSLLGLGAVSNLAKSDDHFVYEGVFNGTTQDDGTNNFEIAHVLIDNVARAAEVFQADERGPKSIIKSSILIDSMLQARAFFGQRSAEAALNPRQKELVDLIVETLAPLDLSYRPDEWPGLVKLCQRDNAVVNRIKSFVAINALDLGLCK